MTVTGKRCSWCGGDTLYQQYHDKEWGVPVHDDNRLFEMLSLEGAQAGLSWITVLKKREHYRSVYDDFDVEKVARYGKRKQNALLKDPGIIRNRLKVAAFTTNAQACLDIKDQHGSFGHYIWQFVNHRPVINTWRTLQQIPSSTKESDAMSKQLKIDGFKFVGTTICYAFMQAVGMVNDHVIDCFRYKPLCKPARRKGK
ncbi:MAG: DNA-3-methyladenine glycosylase I [Gammaproteobacteria bacterium]|nr:MAG: DNA-3-methyladenine glycosylase I [Gammaproteobacteria bacterium]